MASETPLNFLNLTNYWSECFYKKIISCAKKL